MNSLKSLRSFRFSSNVKPNLSPPLARRIFQATILAGVLALSAASANADNIAPFGSGILGVNDAVDGDSGTLHFNAGTLAAIVDGDLNTHVDNWWGNGTTDLGQSVSFVGVLWPSIRYEDFSAITLTLATFGDGGWFGVPGAPAPAGGALAVTNLIDPVVQITTNREVTWTTIQE